MPADSLNVLQQLIQTDSSCNKSNKEIVFFIRKLLSQAEVEVYKFTKSELELYNLIIRIKGREAKKPILFVGHTDTVIANKNWTKDPFLPTIQGDKIYGLGASDMKAGLAAIISAILNLSQKPAQDVYLVFDADEEGRGRGGIEIIKKLKLKNASIIVAEPTSGRIVLGQKGCFDIQVTTEGKSGHSAFASYQKSRQNNSIYKAIEIIKALQRYEKKLVNKQNSRYGAPTLNIGTIKGGEGANVVPGECSFTLSRRVLPTENIQREHQKLLALIKSKEPKAMVETIFYGEPFQTDKNSPLVKQISYLARKHLNNVSYEYFPGWTEAALFKKFGDCIIFGPGLKSQAHTENEFASIKLIKKFTKIYSEFVIGLDRNL